MKYFLNPTIVFCSHNYSLHIPNVLEIAKNSYEIFTSNHFVSFEIRKNRLDKEINDKLSEKKKQKEKSNQKVVIKMLLVVYLFYKG